MSIVTAISESLANGESLARTNSAFRNCVCASGSSFGEEQSAAATTTSNFA